jgi:hypothetical protein
LIVTALIAGATAAAKDTASQAVKDAYSGLKAIIHKRFAGKAPAETALQQHEADPDVWRKPLEKSLTETGAGEDREIGALPPAVSVGTGFHAEDRFWRFYS